MKPVLPLLLASLVRRETPQELSHDRYVVTVKEMLDLNNTISVADPTFGLLANTEASPGMGTIMDADCLQLTIADCAFTNAKSTNNLAGMVAALIYRALERNTPGVGLPSALCISYTPRNKELATFNQHQDPASPGAQENNKATALELARQIALIGGDPIDALYSGTFWPGEVGSTNFAGNACNTANCIFIENSLVRDASEAEIYDYVGKCVDAVTSTVEARESMPTEPLSILNTNPISRPDAASVALTGGSTISTTTRVGTTAPHNPTTSTTQQRTTVTPTTSAPTPTPTGTTNYMTFTGAYLGVSAPQVTQAANGRYHAGTDPTEFRELTLALDRSCDIQKNACANEANRQRQPVSPCDTQLNNCKSHTNS